MFLKDSAIKPAKVPDLCQALGRHRHLALPKERADEATWYIAMLLWVHVAPP